MHSKPVTMKKKFKAIFENKIYKYELLLRKVEYYLNCHKSLVGQAYAQYLWHRLYIAGLRLGFEISPNCFGPGLAIVHSGPILVHYKARIGANCRIYTMVVIGSNDMGSYDAVPTIGNNVRIYPGAKIFGDITIADGIIIGANAVVNKSFLEPNITIAGVPARKIVIPHGTNMRNG